MTLSRLIFFARRHLFLVSVVSSAFLATTATQGQDVDFPEASSGLVEQKGGTAAKFMVAAANPIAVQAGYDAIKAGGNALDAALAVQLVLNLVEPQSSGIGGGAFILYWDNSAQELYAYDGRETAPATATEKRFLTADGKAMLRQRAVIGGTSVGVPGLVAVMELAHQRHGALKWATLFDPAIKVAEEGFEISPRLFRLLDVDEELRKIRLPAEQYYQADLTPKPIGTVLTNPRMAITLKTIAAEGRRGFYRGDVAERIVMRVKETTRNPADITLDDLANYRAVERTPLCAPYRIYKICGMPAPTSGGIGVIQTLGLLEKFDLPNMEPWSVEAAHLFVEASRLVYADRATYIADPDFSPVPQDGLIDRGYIADRAALIDPASRMSKVEAGKPPQKGTFDYGPGRDFERPSTTHISVIDDQGNAVSMTSSIEGAFGSHLMAGGFLLNNQLTDFSYDAVAQGRTVANRVEGGKRPRSSMAPIIVFDENNQIVAVSGSPGGMAIVPLVVKTLIAMLDWKMTPQEATNLPNVLLFGPTVFLEGGTALEAHKEALEALGHRVRVGNFPSGVHALAVQDGVIWGGADPRREGTVMGD
ncbi:MAG: gamma-glutamyltransferase [Rhodospirillaceae bacterium]